MGDGRWEMRRRCVSAMRDEAKGFLLLGWKRDFYLIFWLWPVGIVVLHSVWECQMKKRSWFMNEHYA